jgi:hypothetical protein
MGRAPSIATFHAFRETVSSAGRSAGLAAGKDPLGGRIGLAYISSLKNQS